MRRLEGHVVMVTGAARGLGRACALRCAEEGASVRLVDIARNVETVPYEGTSSDDLESAAHEARGHGVQAVTAIADVRSGAELAAAVRKGMEALGPISGMVAAAGIDSWGKSWEL